MAGFLKVMRGDDLDHLIRRDHPALVLLMSLALRATRTPKNGLEVGEAYLGDYATCGLTEQRYRSAKKRLQTNGLATFRATPKGTIGKILDISVFDINVEDDQRTDQQQANTQATDNQRASNVLATDSQRLTRSNNKELIKKKEEETNVTAVTVPQRQVSIEAKELTQDLWQRIQANNEYAKQPDLEKWAEEMDKILRIDKRDLKATKFLIEWSQQDSFWSTNILSPIKLRKHYEKLFMNARQQWQQKEKNKINSYD